MKCKKVLVIILIFIFAIILYISSYILLRDYKELTESNKSTEILIDNSIEINEKTQEKYIDWEHLKSINEDIVAWIEIEGTNINYPILQDKGTYYLKYSFDKKYNNNGSIFTNNTTPFEDLETIIYGHNMRNGAMFSDLGKYLKKDFLEANSIIKIYTPNKNYKAIVFSAYSIGFDEENNNIKSLDFEDRIKYYKKSSKCKVDEVDNISKIIKLSTCSYINAKTNPTDQRYYIIANLITIDE